MMLVKMYPEQYLGHWFLHRLCKAPQVVVQRCVHHAGVHGVDSHWKVAGCQLLLQVVGEEDQSQFALRVGAMGTVARPRHRGGGGWRGVGRLALKVEMSTNSQFATEPEHHGLDLCGLMVLVDTKSVGTVSECYMLVNVFSWGTLVHTNGRHFKILVESCFMY